MNELVCWVFMFDILALFVLLLGATWSVAFPEKRIWPPPSKRSWQHAITWILFYLVFGLNLVLVFIDWNNWVFDNILRLIVGIPLMTLGSMLLAWGIRTLGVRNTSGLPDGFIQEGPYRFTRNPQYLGDIFLFVGLSIVANSLLLWIAHFLLILTFLVTSIAEEDWLRIQYGDDYRTYFSETSRFL